MTDIRTTKDMETVLSRLAASRIDVGVTEIWTGAVLVLDTQLSINISYRDLNDSTLKESRLILVPTDDRFKTYVKIGDRIIPDKDIIFADFETFRDSIVNMIIRILSQ